MSAVVSVVSSILPVLLKRLTPEIVKGFLDNGLNFVEREVVKTDNPVDDVIVLPLCALVRKSLDIPDTEPNRVIGD